MKKIFILVPSLNIGGAERQLVQFVEGLDKVGGYKIVVGLFHDQGEFRRNLSQIQYLRLVSLNKSGRWDLLWFGVTLAKLLSREKPDILYTFLPEANIAGLVAARISRVPRVVWSIRASNMDSARYGWFVAAILRVARWLSKFPDAIIVNSLSGYKWHKKIGYQSVSMYVVHNGIDADLFAIDRGKGFRGRACRGIPDNAFLLGLVGRLDPMKDHPTFIHAAKLLVEQVTGVRFICIGDGSSAYSKYLLDMTLRLGLKEYFIWESFNRDMPQVYNMFDIMTSSSSYGEGFSNVVGEAMACGVPCVVTDVGDSAFIVGDTGEVLGKIGDPRTLADCWLRMIKKIKNGQEGYREVIRKRILTHFSIEHMVQNTLKVLEG